MVVRLHLNNPTSAGVGPTVHPPLLLHNRTSERPKRMGPGRLRPSLTTEHPPKGSGRLHSPTTAVHPSKPTMAALRPRETSVARLLLPRTTARPREHMDHSPDTRVLRVPHRRVARRWVAHRQVAHR